MSIPLLPADTLAAIAAGGVVRLPVGTFAAPLVINRPAKPLVLVGGPLTIETDLADLVPGERYWGAWVRSDFAPAPWPKGQSRVTGEVRANTTTLRWAEPTPPPPPGERVCVQLGVSADDPNEPVRTVWRTVRAVVGEHVVFDEPLGVDVPTYETFDELRRVAHYPNLQDKVGAWGAYGGYARGLGYDHGVTRFVGGQPTSDVRFDCDLTVRMTGVGSPADYPRGPNGAFSVCVQYGERVEFGDVLVDTSPGAGVHWWHAHDCGMGRLRCRGRFFARVYDTVVYASSAVTMWGSVGVRMDTIDIDAANCGLIDFEVSPQDVRIGRCVVAGPLEFPFDPWRGPIVFGGNGRLEGDSLIGPVDVRWAEDWAVRTTWYGRDAVRLRGLTMRTPGYHAGYGRGLAPWVTMRGPAVFGVG